MIDEQHKFPCEDLAHATYKWGIEYSNDEDGDEGTRRMTLDEITSENLPSADDLEAELQDYLRKQRDDG